MQRVLARMVRRGRAVDCVRLHETALLSGMLCEGHPAALSVDRLTHSHHLPGCSFARAARSRGSLGLVADALAG